MLKHKSTSIMNSNIFKDLKSTRPKNQHTDKQMINTYKRE